MNSYPQELIVQLVPLMFVAGLDNSDDQFIQRLRLVLVQKRSAFVVQFVNSSVQFPPKDSQGHSPLSPLSPSSPLHPDGIIAPIWLRKHTSLLPCVFVLFLPLSEDKDTDKDQDNALCSLISSRKRLTSDRNIKLTVVLFASRRLLDDPALEPRLTFIRRQSGLDARASLFVLSPVGNRELAEFVNSLQGALADAANEYYAAHGRRVRRKRNKHSNPSQLPPPPPPIAQTMSIPRPLRPEGWSIRYSYKLAAFAEFRSEFQVALKHYQEAYTSLCHLFSSPAPLPPSTSVSSSTIPSASSSLVPLPPRTKRWAEAKVLSDCINIKIIKLFLSNNEHSLACSQHYSHVGFFSEISEKRWGIGESTFEYWSWVGRQHRVLAELIDQGLRTTLVLPSHGYKPPKTIVPNIELEQLTQTKLSTGSGLNPAHALLHSGYYYYASARCAEMRRTRFLSALQAEAENNPVSVLSPGFANEKKVDHTGLVVELYTKAYDVFKSPASSAPSSTAAADSTVDTKLTEQVTGPGQATQGSRQTLWIAYRIAETYRRGGKYDMAIRFFDRIAKTYRKERWDVLLRGVLESWFECVLALGVGIEDGMKVLLELMALDGSDRGVDDLLALLKTTKPSLIDKPLVMELSDSSQSLFETATTFYIPTVKLSEATSFQVRMTSTSQGEWKNWEGNGGIVKVQLWFRYAGGEECVVVKRNEAGDDDAKRKRVRKVELGEIILSGGELERGVQEAEADLQWDHDETVVFCGSLRCFRVGFVEVSKVVVIIAEPQNGWVIHVGIVPESMKELPAKIGWWLSSLDPPRFVPLEKLEEGHKTLTVKQRDHLVRVSFFHEAPAYVDEEYAVDVEVRNLDERALHVSLGFLVRPGEDEWIVNWIIVDGERSTSLINGVDLGVVEPGGRVVKRIWMLCTGVRGERIVDVEVVTKVVEMEGDVDAKDEEMMEHLELLVVDAIQPFKVEYEIMYAPLSITAARGDDVVTSEVGIWAGLADLKTFDGTWRDERGKGAGEVVICGRVIVGSERENGGEGRDIVIEKIELERLDGTRSKVIDSDVEVDIEGLYPAKYIEGDEFGVNCRVSLCVDDDGEDEPMMIESLGKYCIMWHRMFPDGTHGASAKTLLDLPSFRPPVSEVLPVNKTQEGGDYTNAQYDDARRLKKEGMNGIVALVRVPPVGKLHVPLRVEVIVRNESPVRTGNVSVSMGSVDEGEGISQPFVIAGIKNGRLGVVLPGEEVRAVWAATPLECGYMKLPKVRVFDWRGVEGGSEGAVAEEVEVVDAGKYFGRREEEVGSVLVLP